MWSGQRKLWPLLGPWDGELAAAAAAVVIAAGAVIEFKGVHQGLLSCQRLSRVG
ncbi:MAG: hypothetical protein OEZ02_11390 [Anaerolineae bacterium]|nr:hypothetical protein [Anaerolineae bacterium]